MTAFVVAILVVPLVLACGEVGARLRAHGAGASLDDDARAMITLGVELLATLASVVLALLLGSAKVDFDARAIEVRDAAVKLVMLDDDLRRVGFLARVHEGSTVIFPLLALIVFWFGLIAAGDSTCSPRETSGCTPST